MFLLGSASKDPVTLSLPRRPLNTLEKSECDQQACARPWFAVRLALHRLTEQSREAIAGVAGDHRCDHLGRQLGEKKPDDVESSPLVLEVGFGFMLGTNRALRSCGTRRRSATSRSQANRTISDVESRPDAPLPHGKLPILGFIPPPSVGGHFMTHATVGRCGVAVALGHC